MKKTPGIHPFLFAIFPVLFLYSHNVSKVYFSDTLIPLAVVLAFAVSLLLFFWLILRDAERAGILVSVSLILIFFYGHVLNLIDGWEIQDQFLISTGIGTNKLLVPAWGIIFIIVFYLVKRTTKNLHGLKKALNIMGVVLLIVPLSEVAVHHLKAKRLPSGTRSIEKFRKSGLTQHVKNKEDTKKTDKYPDIYYIVPDRYTSAEVLKKEFDFDNSRFIDSLTDKGFFVASKSKTNYTYTTFSLASSLNMKYINYLSDQLGTDEKILYTMIKDSEVSRFLKSKGYVYVHVGSGWGFSWDNEWADLNIDWHNTLSSFPLTLYQTTVLYPLTNYFNRIMRWKALMHISSDQLFLKWAGLVATMDNLSEISKIKESTFTLVHMLLPHNPYVVDANGNFVSGGNHSKEGYLDSIMFFNKKIEEFIDKVQSNSEVPPIIIIQADEGATDGLPHTLNKHKIVDFNKWATLSTERVRLRSGILNAYYLPGVDKGALYESITPVNAFRLVFNEYFNTNFELLPDKTYVRTNTSPCTLVDVTDMVAYK